MIVRVVMYIVFCVMSLMPNRTVLQVSFVEAGVLVVFCKETSML